MRDVDRSVARADLVEDLVRVVGSRLLDPLEIMLGGDDAIDSLRERVRARAEAWAAQMLGDDDQLAGRTAIRIVAALYPGDEPFDPPASWWRTPLGRVVMRRVGHPTAESVPVSAAAAMLGVSRQFVHDLMARGKLDRHPDGGVSVASVRARINERSAR